MGSEVSDSSSAYRRPMAALVPWRCRSYPSRHSWPSAAGARPGAGLSVCDGDDPAAEGGVTYPRLRHKA